MLIRHGIQFDAVALNISLAANQQATREVTLRRRFNLRDMGWFGGENHMHVMHGTKDPPATFKDGARLAAGDGLDYIQLAYFWDATLGWTPTDLLNRRSREATTPDVAVGWNIEAPKSYMGPDDGGRAGNLHCFGHGWTVALKDNSLGHSFYYNGPNFHVLQEVHRQGGIVGAAHPVRNGITSNGNIVSNTASELPFDFVAGVPYAAVDILNDSPLLFFESERFWYTLLNLGYKVSGTGNTDGALGTTRGVGIYRTCARIDGEFTWDKLAASIKAGKVIATSGPFVQFTVDDHDPGAEFPADGVTRKANLRAWSSPLPGETILSVQLVRNGEVVRAWDLRSQNAREWETQFDIADDQFAWYCVRVLSSCKDPFSVAVWGPHACELAVANPVYFLPAGFTRPQPASAKITLEVTDQHGTPQPASVSVEDDGTTLSHHEIPPHGGALTLPATASLLIQAPGFEPARRNLYMDCPELFNYCRSIANVWPSFYSPETYHEIRRRLGCLKLRVALTPK
jgi:hypothetical protein